tara:strand:+ start:1187 stop:1849 length:663 start_codon:yes stop_codon:yes gene_type:complete
MSFTFTTLKQAIQDWTENTETTFVNNLNIFIKNAEERILKETDLDYFRKNVAGVMSNGNKFLNMPTDYLASFSLHFTDSSGNAQFLLQKDVNYIQEFNPNPATTGLPRYYAAFDYQNFIIGPTPNANYVTELHYYYRPQSITETSDGQSWLGTNAPNTLLYACLIEAYTFMKGETDLLQLYMNRYAESMRRLPPPPLKVYAEGRENTDAYREESLRASTM